MHKNNAYKVRLTVTTKALSKSFQSSNKKFIKPTILINHKA